MSTHFTQAPLHYVTCVPAQFEVVMANALGGDEFTFIFLHYLTFGHDLWIKVT